jgi:hypothetical protein
LSSILANLQRAPVLPALPLPLLHIPLRLQDGNRDTWSADELADIVAIWRAVAEDFAAFDVDITTEDPGADTLATSGTRVAIGGAYQDCEWLGMRTGIRRLVQDGVAED